MDDDARRRGRPPHRRQHIGPAVRELRRRRGWTIDDLARTSGMSRSQISRLERGQSVPSYLAVLSLAQLFEVDLGYFTAYEQMSAQLETDLAAFLRQLGIPPALWSDLFRLSVEARGALVDALRWLTFTDTTAPEWERDLVRYLLEDGVQSSLDRLAACVSEHGFTALQFGRTLTQTEQLPGERMTLADRLVSVTVPVDSGIDPVEIYRSSFADEPPTTELIRWWAQALRSAVSEAVREYPSRSIYPIRTIQRYIETGCWGPGLLASPDEVRKHVATTIQLLRSYPRYRIGFTEADVPLNILIKADAQALVYTRSNPDAAGSQPPRVALKFSRPDLVRQFRMHFDELWDAIPEEQKDPMAVAEWLESHLAAASR